MNISSCSILGKHKPYVVNTCPKDAYVQNISVLSMYIPMIIVNRKCAVYVYSYDDCSLHIPQ